MYMYLFNSFTTEYIFFSFMREREDRKDTERERERERESDILSVISN